MEGQTQREGTERIAPIFTDLATRAAEKRDTPSNLAAADVPDDDEDAIAELYAASPRRPAVAKPATSGHTSIFGPAAVVPLPGAAGEEEEDEDDLAALLAEGGMDVDTVTSAAAPTKAVPEVDEFDDEMDAMAEMGW